MLNFFKYLLTLILDFFSAISSGGNAVVPTGPPVPPTPYKPVPPSHTVTLADIIRAYNSPFKSMYPVGSTTVNAEIHNLPTSAADKIADLILSESVRTGIDMYYLAACIMQESRFDPACYNHNLGHDRTTISFEHTDWGMCQMAGTYLPDKPGMQGLSQIQMAAKATDANWSIPMMADIMVGHLASAKKYFATDAVFQQNTTRLNTTSLTDAQFAATLFYNRGEADDTVNKRGGRYYIKNDIVDEIKHPYRVAHWYDAFQHDLKQNTTVFSKYFDVQEPFELAKQYDA